MDRERDISVVPAPESSSVDVLLLFPLEGFLFGSRFSEGTVSSATTLRKGLT